MEFVGSPVTTLSPELVHCFPLLLLRRGSADMLRPSMTTVQPAIR